MVLRVYFSRVEYFRSALVLLNLLLIEASVGHREGWLDGSLSTAEISCLLSDIVLILAYLVHLHLDIGVLSSLSTAT